MTPLLRLSGLSSFTACRDPVQPGAAASTRMRVRPSPAGSSVDTSGLFVLVVGTPRPADTLALQLGALGHGALVAGSADAALMSLREHPFDLVLADDDRVSGHGAPRLVRRLRRQEARMGGHVPITVTATSTQGRRDEWLKAGADEFLSKPVHIGDLRRQIEGQRVLVARWALTRACLGHRSRAARWDSRVVIRGCPTAESFRSYPGLRGAY